MNWKRKLGLMLITLLLAGILAYGFREQPVMVEIEPAVVGSFQVSVEEEGQTRVIDRFVLSAPVAAYARRIEHEVGDPVRQNEVLLSLDPQRSTVLDPRSRAQAQANVAIAEDALHAAKEDANAAAASAELASTDLRRIQRLRKINHATADEEDHAAAEQRRAEAILRAANFAVSVAQHRLEAAQTVLKYSAATQEPITEQVEMRALIDGQVLKIYHKSEGAVAAGEPLIEIGNPRALEVEVEVLSADAVRIHPGTRVIFERWGGDKPLEGMVRTVEPVGFTKISALGVEEQRVHVIADITSAAEDWQRLGDGYRVEARFILWEENEVLQIPASALFRDQAGWAVFTINNGRAQKRQVEIGQRNGLQAQIISGLNAGEAVITHPDAKIEHGRRIKPRY